MRPARHDVGRRSLYRVRRDFHPFVFRGQTADLNYFSFPQWRGRFRGDALCVEREVDLAFGLLLRSIGVDDRLVMLGLADTGRYIFHAWLAWNAAVCGRPNASAVFFAREMQIRGQLEL